MIVIHKFITEEDIEYYKSLSNNDIKNILKIWKQTVPDEIVVGRHDIPSPRKIIGLPDGDLDILLEQFREKKFTNYCRKDGWSYYKTNVMNNDGHIYPLQTRTANFRFVNKWKQEGYISKYRIIIDENKKIVWIGQFKDKQYFISVDKKIYELGYEHKDIKLFPNICSENEYFDEDNIENNDDIVRKYRKNVRTYRFTTIDDVQRIFEEEKIGTYISLEEHFEKGFFYKGFKWNKNWKEYYGYDYITILIDIMTKNGLFYIEIENITYPFYGYILLDLDKLKIIEAKKV